MVGAISAASGIAPLSASVYTYRQQSRDIKVLSAYFLFLLFVEGTMEYYAYHKMNNLWFGHFVTPIEFGVFTYVFSRWQKSRTRQLILQVSIPVIILAYIVVNYQLENLTSFNTYTRPAVSVILIIISSLILYDLYKSRMVTLFKNIRFWIALGVLTYNAGTVALFSMINIFLAVSPSLAFVAMLLHTVLNITSNIFFAKGYLCLRTQTNSGGGL